MGPRRSLVAATTLGLVAAGVLPALAGGEGSTVDVAPTNRETEPVVLTGAAFPGWAVPAEITVKLPETEGVNCTSGSNSCSHNQYEDPEVATRDKLGRGPDVDTFLGYRWDAGAGRFVQIPFQVDELAVRYLSNNASTFSFYSQTDQHATYVWDEERWRWTASSREDPCLAAPAGEVRTTLDPVRGLDTDDEVVFMASDAGPPAPGGAALPEGIAEARTVTVTDPVTQQRSFVYVMRAAAGGPEPAFTAENGYVRYLPDADSDVFLFSQSAYRNYGNAPKGPYFDPARGEEGECVTDPKEWKQRRPRDTAWIKTPTYAFRYEGRWLMTEHRVAPEGAANEPSEKPSAWEYGPDLVDQWKARAFQQRPGGQTPCCGYEEEVNNWGGSSMLMGWRAGPVRVIRAHWGSDSATNNVRTEIFYRDEVRQVSNLRVHVIPPGDGIYAQWDMNAGKVTRYYNPFVPEGVPVDGANDESFGNGRVYASTDGASYSSDDPYPGQDIGTPHGERCPESADDVCLNNDVDTVDPTFSGPAGTLGWEQLTGPYGTFVERWSVKQVTGGAAYSAVTTPYYRDDSCFDDGTGTDPGTRIKPRAVDPPVDSAGAPRECWNPSHGDPLAFPGPRDHFWQGSIGTHGIHILLIADSDNAFTTQPVDEIVAEHRRVVLRGERGNVGEQYGRAFEKPLVVTVAPV